MITKPSKLQRQQLDKQFKALQKKRISYPPAGWIRTIRTSLGMNATQLAKRLKVTPQTIKDYEKAEENGAITVATLQKIAEELGCELLLTMIPKKSLQAIIKDQALKAAMKIVGGVDKQMKLENQETGKDFKNRQILELADEIERNMSHELWED